MIKIYILHIFLEFTEKSPLFQVNPVGLNLKKIFKNDSNVDIIKTYIKNNPQILFYTSVNLYYMNYQERIF